MTACKIALNTLVHRDNKDEEMSGTSGPSKNKDILLHSGAATFTSNHILVNEDDSNFDAGWYAYETVLIAFIHN